jgi:hypothetical protein
MGEEPDEIRKEIGETRERMGETAEALAYKADVPTRTKERVTGTLGNVRDRVSGAAPDPGEVKGQARRAVGIAQENPLGLAVASIAAGFMVGMMIPATRVEQERVGPVAEQVKEQARETAQTAVEQGKQVAQEAAQSATQTARESGRESAEQVRSKAAEGAQQVREAPGGPGGQGA